MPNKNCPCNKSLIKSFGDPIIIQFPVMIKASTGKSRIIEFEASAAIDDFEGDVIEQKALLDSKNYFLENGFIDIDHYAELGKNPAYFFLNIEDPDSWKVGKPIEVIDLGNYRTGIKAEIFSNPNGDFDPKKYKYDWIWQHLKEEPGQWKASVYGYPGPDTQEGGCTEGTDGVVCATRYLVKTFRWCSTALTKNPINQKLEKAVTIISAKAFAAKLGYIKPFIRSFNREAVFKSYVVHINGDCPETDSGITIHTLRGHYINCERMEYSQADLYALATAELIRRYNN